MFNFNDSIGKKIIVNDEEVILVDYNDKSITVKNKYGLEEELSLDDAKIGDLNNEYGSQGAHWVQKSFEGTDFKEADFRYSELENCIFTRCNFDHAQFTGATVKNSFFTACNLSNMYTNSSNFEGNTFKDCVFANDREVKYLESSNKIDYDLNYYAKLFEVNGEKVFKYAKLNDPLAFAERKEDKSEQVRVNRKRELKPNNSYYYWVIREIKGGYSGDDVYAPIPSTEEFVESADEKDYEVSPRQAVRKGMERIRELAESSDLVIYGLCTWRANNYILYIDEYVAQRNGEGIYLSEDNPEGLTLVYKKTLTRQEAIKEKKD